MDGDKNCCYHITSLWAQLYTYGLSFLLQTCIIYLHFVEEKTEGMAMIRICDLALPVFRFHVFFFLLYHDTSKFCFVLFFFNVFALVLLTVILCASLARI